VAHRTATPSGLNELNSDPRREGRSRTTPAVKTVWPGPVVPVPRHLQASLERWVGKVAASNRGIFPETVRRCPTTRDLHVELPGKHRRVPDRKCATGGSTWGGGRPRAGIAPGSRPGPLQAGVGMAVWWAPSRNSLAGCSRWAQASCIRGWGTRVLSRAHPNTNRARLRCSGISLRWGKPSAGRHLESGGTCGSRPLDGCPGRPAVEVPPEGVGHGNMGAKVRRSE